MSFGILTAAPQYIPSVQVILLAVAFTGSVPTREWFSKCFLQIRMFVEYCYYFGEKFLMYICITQSGILKQGHTSSPSSLSP